MFVLRNYINTPEPIRKKKRCRVERGKAALRAWDDLTSLAHFPYIRSQKACSARSQQTPRPRESLRFYISVCGTGKGL